ncbi:DUF4889 domain-containing protein [Staphylococcus canis]|uniref:DUF4889 domain-containing protein n=1 Tax=Staphylococcus canis TaxID=2724942 RepID=A0ABS0T990_9STAP|nr:DUF4889 domain-containing protein [Staphylococcus canis]MBI5974323.1 DUF4889 domain-containing protein [Staphylococcus canis]
MKKNKQAMGFILIVVMLVITAIIVVGMMMSSQKETYYGYMKNETTAEKVINASEKTVEENVTIPSDQNFQPQAGDFVRLVKNKGDEQFSKKEVVSHDDVPHGLMMKIHDMHMSH